MNDHHAALIKKWRAASKVLRQQETDVTRRWADLLEEAANEFESIQKSLDAQQPDRPAGDSTNLNVLIVREAS